MGPIASRIDTGNLEEVAQLFKSKIEQSQSCVASQFEVPRPSCALNLRVGRPCYFFKTGRYPIVSNANSSFFLTWQQSTTNSAATDPQDAASYYSRRSQFQKKATESDEKKLYGPLVDRCVRAHTSWRRRAISTNGDRTYFVRNNFRGPAGYPQPATPV